jgi:hypothetical protein
MKSYITDVASAVRNTISSATTAATADDASPTSATAKADDASPASATAKADDVSHANDDLVDDIDDDISSDSGTDKTYLPTKKELKKTTETSDDDKFIGKSKESKATECKKKKKESIKATDKKT